MSKKNQHVGKGKKREEKGNMYRRSEEVQVPGSNSWKGQKGIQERKHDGEVFFVENKPYTAQLFQ